VFGGGNCEWEGDSRKPSLRDGTHDASLLVWRGHDEQGEDIHPTPEGVVNDKKRIKDAYCENRGARLQ